MEQYLATVTEYHDVIAAQMFAHVHSNELRALPNGLMPDGPPLLVQGSIAPCYTTNPFFTLVLFDRNETLRPIDLVTYEVDLTVHDQSIAANPDSGGIWTRMFDNLTSYLNVAGLTNRDTQLLSERLVQNNATFEAYFQSWYKGTIQNCTTDTCRRKEACLVACGFDNTSWQDCINNNQPGTCNLGVPVPTSSGGQVRWPRWERRRGVDALSSFLGAAQGLWAAATMLMMGVLL